MGRGGGISARSGGKTGAKARLPASRLLQQLLPASFHFFSQKKWRDFNRDEVMEGDERIEPSLASPLTRARGGPAVSVLPVL